MGTANWLDLLSAIGDIATPVALAGLGFVLTRRLNRNTELLKTRLEAYKALAPDLNTLMCYMTFIGTWVDHSPTEIVALKRSLDTRAFTALPLFEPPRARDAYDSFMDACFKPFGRWGQDALIRSGPYRRRTGWRRTDITWD